MNRCYANYNDDTKELSSLSTTLDRIQLPLYSKYLLIAAYIASYNPIAADKKFMKQVVQ